MNEDEEEIHSRKHDEEGLTNLYGTDDFLGMEGDEEFLSRRGGGRKLWSMMVGGQSYAFPDMSRNLQEVMVPGCTEFNQSNPIT